MLNFYLMTDKDRKEAAAIERRRTFEEERKKRIFNPRMRQNGVDYAALQTQMEERNKQKGEERRIQEIFEQQERKNGEIALALMHKEKEERLKIQQEINNFRATYQRPEDRREFDLNDPNYFRKSLPARLHDNDPRCGPASAQKFEGEDLVSDDRMKIQRNQLKSVLDQQIQEKEAAQRQRREAEEAYNSAVLVRDRRALELDRMEKECRKRLHEACLRFNRALADERDFDRKKKEREELEDNLAEMYNNMTSDLLCENPEAGQSNLGPTRTVGYIYKGMTPEQKEIFRREQLAQVEEQRQRKELDGRLEKEFDEYLNGIQKTIYMMDQELERKQKERTKVLFEENLKLAEEQRKQKEFLEKIVYTNKPTAAYFDQFNKSTR